MNNAFCIIIPACIGLYETIAPPSIGIVTEIDLLLIRQVAHRSGFHEDGVGVYLNLPVKCKDIDLGVIYTHLALYDRPLSALHCTPGIIGSDTVFGVVCHSVRTKCIAILIDKFHKRPVETHQILINEIDGRFA